MERLTRGFFDRPFLTVAQELPGHQILWNGCGGTIVEVEAYAVTGDPACHTATRPSSREFVKNKPPGTAYVYLNYGMYWLLNVLVRDGILLIRALEPTHGIATMQRRRNRTKLTDLCSGPGKIGMALGLNAESHGVDLAISSPKRPAAFFAKTAVEIGPIVADVRIGISTATEFPWRFLVRDNPHVSVPYPAPRAKIGTAASRRRVEFRL